MIDLVLAIDISTGGIHVCLVDPSLNIIYRQYEEFEYLHSETPGAKEIATAALWSKLLAMVKEAVISVGQKSRIKEISVTSQREGCVFLNNEDMVLSACPNIDSRAKKTASSLPQETKQRLYEITGHWPDCYFPAMRLLWFRKHKPDLFAKIDRFMMLNEWIAYSLLGSYKDESRVETTNAAESMLFDVSRLNWSKEALEILGMEQLRLSKVVAPGTVVGTMDKDLAEDLGLAYKTGVKLSMADTQSALLGSGALNIGDMVIVNGSTTPVQFVIDKPIIDKEGRTWTCPYLPGLWVLESNCRRTGIIFRKLRKDLQDLLSCIDNSFTVSNEKLDRIIFESAPETYDTLSYFGPGTFNVSEIAKKPSGILFSDERVNIFKAILVGYIENLAFSIRSNVEQLENICGRSPKRIIATGGAFKSSLLKKLLPIVLKGRSLYITGNLDTTAIGATIIGREKEHSAKKLFSESLTTMENSEDAFYEEKYIVWKKWYQSLEMETLQED